MSRIYTTRIAMICAIMVSTLHGQGVEARVTTYLPPIPNAPQASGVYGPGWWWGNGPRTIIAPTPIAPPWAMPPANWPALFRDRGPEGPFIPSINAQDTPNASIPAHQCRRVYPGPIPQEPPNGYTGVLIEPDGGRWPPGAIMAPMRLVWAWQCAAWASAIDAGNRQAYP